MEPLKYTYNKTFINSLSNAIKQVYPKFDVLLFNNTIFDNNWDNLELKQRMRHITLSLKEQLPVDYKLMVKIILDLIKVLKKTDVNEQGFEWMFLPEFIELYGLKDFNTSVKAFEICTQFVSCEFAVRPFIVEYPQKMMQQMLLWSKHKNEHVRRLASEGCRPRLPWAMALPLFKNDPKAIMPILEILKNDSSEYVRRSVANNLNDIAKDNPKKVIEIAHKWIGNTLNTDKLVKHASRTLLKEGNQEIMKLFGFGSVKNIKIFGLIIKSKTIKIGDYLQFDFSLKNIENTSIKIRLEYAIYYQKASGSLSKKVYKISEKEYQNNSITNVNRKQSFKIISTRKFHLGLHQIAIIVNGNEFEKHDFYLE